MDDDELAGRLRAELHREAQQADPPTDLLATAQRRSTLRYRTRIGLVAAAAVVAILGAGLFFAVGEDDPASLDVTGPPLVEDRNGRVDPTPPGRSANDEQPSQSPVEAARDVVVPALAEVPITTRSEPVLRVDRADQSWVISRIPATSPVAGSPDCLLGDREGRRGTEYICVAEYGEVLLLAEDGSIARAFPMPALLPSWLHVADDVVYAGRVGDGALPASSIVRIDRDTFEVEVVVFPSEASPSARAERIALERPGWRLATAAERERLGELVVVGEEAAEPFIESWIGPVSVDIGGLEELFATP